MELGRFNERILLLFGPLGDHPIVVLTATFLTVFLTFSFRHELDMATRRNMADSLFLAAELATESGGNYGSRHTAAQKSHAELIQGYVDHMNSRRVPTLLRVLPSSRKNFVKRLAEIAEYLTKTVPSGDDELAQCQARENIEWAAEAIAQLLTDSGLLMGEPITAFEPEVMSEEMQVAIRNSLAEAHEKAEVYANDLNVANAEEACMANRRAIVYLYLARFGYQEIIGEEELRTFRTDLNRTISQNRLLQQSDAMKGGKGIEGSGYSIFENHSASERRRFRLLQAIIDNDIQEAQRLLQMAIITAMSDNESSVVPP